MTWSPTRPWVGCSNASGGATGSGDAVFNTEGDVTSLESGHAVLDNDPDDRVGTTA